MAPWIERVHEKAFVYLDKFIAWGPRIFLFKYYVESMDKLMKHLHIEDLLIPNSLEQARCSLTCMNLYNAPTSW